MTHEFKEIISAYKKAKNNHIRTVLATVVAIDGSSYRRPGVGMLIQENGTMTGAVSGGCVEREVLRQAQDVFQKDIPKMMTYNGRYRLGCEGVLYILIEPFVLANETIISIEHWLASRLSFCIETYYTKEDGVFLEKMKSVISFEGKETFDCASQQMNDEKEEISLTCFKRNMSPCFRLIIIGSEHDAEQLSRIASATGWEVEVVSAISNVKQLKDFPGATKIWKQDPDSLRIEHIDQQTAIILMTHNFAKDLLYLQALKNETPVYIGLLGPSRRREKLLSTFIEYHPEVSDHFMNVIYGPTGLNLGAETPQEIAISIIAEILSVTRGQKPISLHQKTEGIHADIEETI